MRTHLQRLIYENKPTKNSPTKLKYEESLTKTHLRDLINDNNPTRTYLLTYLRNLVYKSYLEIHIYKKLIYEISPKTTNLQELTLTKLTYEIHLQELNYRNYKILRRNTHLQKLIYKTSPTRTNPQKLTQLSFSHKSGISIVSGILKNIPFPYFSLVLRHKFLSP